MFIIMFTKFEFKSFDINLFHVTTIVLLVPGMYACQVVLQKNNRSQIFPGYLPKLESKFYEIKVFLKLQLD
jgi:uncharacterized membrane protein YjjB (DUF3815 family)